MSTDKFSMRVRRGVTYNIAPDLCVAAMSPATILLAFDILIKDVTIYCKDHVRHA